MTPVNSTTSAVLLVDDHPAVRHSVGIFLTSKGLIVAGEAESHKEAIALVDKNHFDMAIVDLTLNKGSGLKLIADLKLRNIPSLVYSMHESSSIVDKALAQGALGYVTKREDPKILIKGVQEVLKGNRYVSPYSNQNVVEQTPLQSLALLEESLSEREAQVLDLMGRGEMNSEIGKALDISARTVETYYIRIIGKLEIPSVKELRKYAISRKLEE